MGGNISYGNNTVTKTSVNTTEVERSQTAGLNEKERAKHAKNILAAMEKVRKEQEKILSMVCEVYGEYSTNELSVAINSMEMTIQKIDTSIHTLKEFGA